MLVRINCMDNILFPEKVLDKEMIVEFDQKKRFRVTAFKSIYIMLFGETY